MWKDKAQKVKDHVVKYRVPYIFGTSCAFGYMLMSRGGKPAPKISNIGSGGEFPSIQNNINGNNNTLHAWSVIEANRQGPPSWVVQCVDTGEVFASQNAACRVTGVAINRLSEHLNGKREMVDGLTFKRVCLAA